MAVPRSGQAGYIYYDSDMNPSLPAHHQWNLPIRPRYQIIRQNPMTIGAGVVIFVVDPTMMIDKNEIYTRQERWITTGAGNRAPSRTVATLRRDAHRANINARYPPQAGVGGVLTPFALTPGMSREIGPGLAPATYYCMVNIRPFDDTTPASQSASRVHLYNTILSTLNNIWARPRDNLGTGGAHGPGIGWYQEVHSIAFPFLGTPPTLGYDMDTAVGIIVRAIRDFFNDPWFGLGDNNRIEWYDGRLSSPSVASGGPGSNPRQIPREVGIYLLVPHTQFAGDRRARSAILAAWREAWDDYIVPAGPGNWDVPVVT